MYTHIYMFGGTGTKNNLFINIKKNKKGKTYQSLKISQNVQSSAEMDRRTKSNIQ